MLAVANKRRLNGLCYGGLCSSGTIPLAAAGVLLSAVVLMPGCSGNSANGASGNDGQAAFMAMAAPVRVAQSTIRTVPVEVHVIGNVEAHSTVTVRAQIDGELQRVYFTEGQDVNAGDLLFTIDPRPYEARLQQS